MNWTSDLRRIRHALQRNLLLKIFSLVFAIGLWAFVNLGARDAEKTLVMPLELRNVPPELVITSPVVDAVDVRVRGPRTILGTIDDRRLTIRLDLSSVRPGNTSFKIDPEILALPRGVRVTRLSPVEVNLEIERLVTRSLEVSIGSATVVPDGYRLVDLQIRPRTVAVTGPASEIRDLKGLATGPLRLLPGANGFEQSVEVERPSTLSRVAPSAVVARGRLEEVIVSREFKGVAVGIAGAAGPESQETPRVDVTLRGPERILSEFRPSAESVFVEVAGVEPGKRSLKVQTQLPDGVEVLKVQPEVVKVQVPAPGDTDR